MTIRKKDKDIFLNRQDKVNAEIFYAIEALGHRLQTTEQVRDDLSERLNHIESGAEVDRETGKFFLPLVIDPEELPETKTSSSKGMIAASFVSFFFAATALAVVFTKTPEMSGDYLTRSEFAALKTETQMAVSDWKTVEQVKRQEKQDRMVGLLLERLEKNEQMLADLQLRQSSTENQYAQVLAELQESREYFAQKQDSVEERLAKVNTRTVEKNVPKATQKTVAPVVAKVVETRKPVQETTIVKKVVAQKPQPVKVEKDKTIWVAENSETPVTSSKEKPPAMAKVAEKKAETLAAIEPAAGLGVKRVPSKTADGMKSDSALPAELKSLEGRAFEGDSAAQHDLGALYASGQVMPADYKRAAYWFLKAAEQAVPNAHYNLGVMYHQGLGLGRDVEKALYWYREAASLGHPEALYNLGIAYVEGIGTKPDVDRGVGYLKRAANVGVAQAAYNLGVLYESHFGSGGTDDIQKAIQWYGYAGELGYTDGKAAVKRLTGKAALDTDFMSGRGQNHLKIPENLNDIETAAGDYQLFPPVAMMEQGSASEDVFDVQESQTPKYNVQMVARIKRMLMDLGLLQDGQPSGHMTVKTADAIRSFQQRSGLSQDGIPTQDLLDFMLYNGRQE